MILQDGREKLLYSTTTITNLKRLRGFLEAEKNLIDLRLQSGMDISIKRYLLKTIDGFTWCNIILDQKVGIVSLQTQSCSTRKAIRINKQNKRLAELTESILRTINN